MPWIGNSYVYVNIQCDPKYKKKIYIKMKAVQRDSIIN